MVSGKTSSGQGVVVQRRVIWKVYYWKDVVLKKFVVQKEGYSTKGVNVKGFLFLNVCYLPKYVKLRNLGSEKVSYPKGM